MRGKRLYKIPFGAIVAIALFWCSQVVAGGYGHGVGGPNVDLGLQGSGYLTDGIFLSPFQELDTTEQNAILFMREEEKLARDVYLTLRDKWGLIIFDNIASSEQRHMDMVGQLIEKYGLEDPVTDDSIGVFQNEILKGLYEDLVSRGEESVVEALRVGATIEDLDISDLETRLGETDNDDIRQVFENLKNGSYNHMRSFYSALSSYGESYNAQYISQEELEGILEDSNGHGYAYRGSSYTMLPGTINRFDNTQKAALTLEPTIEVMDGDLGGPVNLYALMYSYELDKWFLVNAPNSFVEWTPGIDELKPFATLNMASETLEFPVITQPVDVTGLQGTFDLYFGYIGQGGHMVYGLNRLIFE